MRFRKRPVVIDAIQWTGSNDDEVAAFAGADSGFELEIFVGEEGEAVTTMAIRTLEGLMTVSKGDWVIRGIQNELYPCKPDIFEATYEAVEDAS